MTYEAVKFILIVATVITSICAWWLFFVTHQEYWLELTRQRLFAIRNDLFDAALEGKISFNDPAYVMTRSTINGMIRFAHQINLLQLLMIFITHKFVFKFRRATDYQSRFTDALKSLSLENKKLILSTIGTAHLIMMRHVISTSPLLWPVLKPLSVVLKYVKRTNQVRKWALKGPKRKESWSLLDAEANYAGNIGDDDFSRCLINDLLNIQRISSLCPREHDLTSMAGIFLTN